VFGEATARFGEQFLGNTFFDQSIENERTIEH
jgi:hypothetical protein